MSETTVRPAPTGRREGRYWAYLGATAAMPIVTSSVWYGAFAEVYSTLLAERGIDLGDFRPEAWQMVGQLVRNGVVVVTIATLVRKLRITRIGDALRLGLLLWLGFQAMAVVGSVLHERYPLGLYLIHVGDALQATLVMAFLVAVASRPRGTS
jgi:hypothetical protein